MVSLRRGVVSLAAKTTAIVGLVVTLGCAVLAAPGPAYADLGPHAYTLNVYFQVTNTNGVKEQFTIGGTNGCTVYHRWGSAPGVTPSGGWSTLGGCAIRGYGLDVGMNQDGRLEVFVIGTDHAVWHRWQSAAGRGPWSGWFSMGGYAISGPSVFSRFNGSNVIGLHVTGSDHGIWNRHQAAPNCCWTPWNEVT